MHQYPEPSFEETWTHNYILNHSVILIARSNHLLAVMALKQRLKEKWPYCGISRDFDALPVQELNDVPYKSKNDGFMHACGHDGHTILLVS